MADRQSEIQAALGLGKSRRLVPRWAYMLALVVAIGGGLYAWNLQTAKGQAIIYDTAAVSRADLRVTVTATGTIEPTNQVEISSELSGTVAKVLVDFNDTVTAGQVLAQLDVTQLDAKLAVQQASHAVAQAQVANAQASLAEARLNYDTVKQLDDRGITTRSNMAAAEAGLARAEANLASANANLDLTQAQLDAQKAEVAKACICSPINGFVLRRAVDEGQIVAAALSAPVLFTIAEDLRKMELQVDVSEADIGRIKVGDKATFNVDAYDEQGFPAVISMVRYASETIDGLVTYKAILAIENEALLLRPGMTATADITVAEFPGALVVPNAALRFAPPQKIGTDSNEGSGGGLLGLLIPQRPAEETGKTNARSVWVLRDGQPTEVAVERGDSNGTVTQILSGQLAEGDLVIVDMTEGK